ncbi:unnamed protein product [Closterium sp. NIES-53]
MPAHPDAHCSPRHALSMAEWLSAVPWPYALAAYPRPCVNETSTSHQSPPPPSPLPPPLPPSPNPTGCTAAARPEKPLRPKAEPKGEPLARPEPEPIPRPEPAPVVRTTDAPPVWLPPH